MMTGCTFDKYRICSVDGNRPIDEQTHTVFLRLARPVQSGNVHSFPEDMNTPSRFAFYFVGKTNETALDKITGNYQYENRASQPLELSYSTSSNAVFMPKPDCMENGYLKSGLYNINLSYLANGQNYTGDFHIQYKAESKIRWVFFWDFYRMPK